MMDLNLDNFIDNCKSTNFCTHLELQAGQYLSDYFTEQEEPDYARIMAFVHEKATKAGLKVFICEGDELKQYYDLKDDKLGVAVIAKNKDNAIINLKNQKNSFVLKQ